MPTLESVGSRLHSDAKIRSLFFIPHFIEDTGTMAADSGRGVLVFPRQSSLPTFRPYHTEDLIFPLRKQFMRVTAGFSQKRSQAFR